MTIFTITKGKNKFLCDVRELQQPSLNILNAMDTNYVILDLTTTSAILKKYGCSQKYIDEIRAQTFKYFSNTKPSMYIDQLFHNVMNNIYIYVHIFPDFPVNIAEYPLVDARFDNNGLFTHWEDTEIPDDVNEHNWFELDNDPTNDLNYVLNLPKTKIYRNIYTVSMLIYGNNTYKYLYLCINIFVL